MAVLGKRKSREPPAIKADDHDQAADIFRKHFEAQFAPLPVAGGGAEQAAASTTTAPSESQRLGRDEDAEPSDSSSSSSKNGGGESEWEGLSDDEMGDEDKAPVVVEVVDHSVSQQPETAGMSKRELKAFMSSRPPTQTDLSKEPSTSTNQQTSSSLPEDAPSLLAQDLELRRLISESHLLTPSSRSLSSPSSAEPRSFAAGRTRLKATDMRVQALGSKASIHTQAKMPMSMRKGMAAVATARESKRRHEARENGVILERETGSKGKGKSRRLRDGGGGVDRPGVGRLRGAELRLSERDVRNIEGTRDVFGRRSKRRS